MDNTTADLLGYRVMFPSDEQFVDFSIERGVNFLTSCETLPVPRGDAFRRLAAFLDENPEYDHNDFEVQPVYRELKPIESGARELGSLLKSLCARNGIKLGLTDDQIHAQIERELKAFGAS